jgi:EAL domain-containing protein (putative c-di-GMP-specific phosphodiesterase class I)
VARLGGDEFTVLLPNVTNPADIDRVARAITRALKKPFQLGEDQLYTSASIGITVYPDDAATVEALLKNADQAMYSAKREGRSRYAYFTYSMQEDAQQRMRLVRDLHQALDANEFLIHFQPIVDLGTGRVRKAEALLRWNHPSRGFVSPVEFIPVAEDTGAINDIGAWVFKEATVHAKRWQSLYDPGFQISVNKSPVQFHAESSSKDRCIEHLMNSGLPGNSIVIEITERLLLNADRGISDKLLVLRDAGVQVAIDDFGTGYSSLSYLKKFDIDYLKIDQSFVRNLATDESDLALSEAIVVMAHKLGLKVIAEGVETEQQRDILCNIGCDFGQGYFFSRPLPPDAFETYLMSGGQGAES